MRTIIPRQPSDLFPFAAQAGDGCQSLQAVLGITHNTEERIRAELTAARAAENEFEAAKAARQAATRRQSETLGASTKWLYSARDYLKHFLGRGYSHAWSEAGLVSNSLQVPAVIDQRLELLKSLELYFEAHPEHESAQLSIAHGKARTWYSDLSAAVTVLNNARTLQRSKRVARDKAVKTLRSRMRGLINELKQLLDAHDPRWLDFGFNIPADQAVPDVPGELSIANGAAGQLLVRWSRTARALRYHVFKKVLGHDTGFVRLKTTTETSVEVNSFSAGQRVQIRVSASNHAGDSLPSKPVEQAVT